MLFVERICQIVYTCYKIVHVNAFVIFYLTKSFSLRINIIYQMPFLQPMLFSVDAQKCEKVIFQYQYNGCICSSDIAWSLISILLCSLPKNNTSIKFAYHTGSQKWLTHYIYNLLFVICFKLFWHRQLILIIHTPRKLYRYPKGNL